MFDEFVIDVQDITAQETLYDWYENQRQYCEDCGGLTYFSTDSECFFCRKGVN